MAIRAVVFDCFGVLVTSARIALKNDYPQFVEQIDDLDHQADYGMISRQEFNQALSDLIGLPVEQIESKYWGRSVRIQRSFDWMNELKSRGYKIGLLSNVGRGFFDSYFTENERSDLFDGVTLSNEVGVAKPDIATYCMIADKLEVKPEDCAMVDDTHLNIEAAENVGMRGVWFINVDQAKKELDKILEVENA